MNNRNENKLHKITINNNNNNNGGGGIYTVALGRPASCPLTYTGWAKKLAPFLYALTLPHINRFSKLFHF